MEVLISNGRIVNAHESKRADLLIKDGKIRKIGENLLSESSSVKTIDASGHDIFPGGIDPHVHMHLPTPAGFSADDFLSGSKAALYGGTTTILDFVTPKKGQKLPDAIEERKAEAQKCLTNDSFHVSPIEWRESIPEEIEEAIQKGFRSFKVYMAYKDSIGLYDEALLKVMKAIGIVEGTLLVHCEMGDEIEALRNQLFEENKTAPEYHPLSRPPELEAQAVKKAINFAAEANCTLYIVHVSTSQSLEYIREAQLRGQKVYAETCPQYLLLNDRKYQGDFKDTAAFVMSPPLRKKEDNLALWDAMKEGVVKTIGTDHCPFTLKQKESGKNDFRKIPNGAGGLEHRISLLYTYGVLEGKISLNQLIELTSTNAAKIFGLYPQKGLIAEGSDADLVIWNPHSKGIISSKTHHMNCDLNIYEGSAIKGSAEVVILAGQVVLEKGKLIEQLSHGKFLRTKSSY